MEQEFKKQALCSPYNILIRRESAKYSRECQRIKKEQGAIARTFRQSTRKLRAAQRGVDSLLGKTSCINQDNILYEQNHPGFCYRRNGEPRLQNSLAESKTRRIVHDLDGREGILPELASNVVSDNPIMGEILSEPDIVSLLCDLRTTAALMDNKKLFNQFALALLHNSHTPLPFKTQLGEDPMACLRHYRTNLIQELLDSLQRNAATRLRRGVGMSSDIALRYLLALPNKGDGKAGAVSPMDQIFGGEKAPMTLQEWNDALLARLRVAQQERFHKKFKNFSNDGTPDSENSNASTTTSASTTYMRQQMRGFGIRGIQSLRKVTPSNYGFRKFGKPSTAPSVSVAPAQLLNTNANETKFTSGFQTPSSPATGSGGGMSMAKSVTYSNRMMVKMKKNREEIKRRYRDEFDSFVKSLISEVENIAEVGNTINEMRHKNPARTRPTTRPLVKLLQKKSLFTSLNEDDLIFYEFEGGRQAAEKELAHELSLSNNKPTTAYLKPGGFTFHVPSRVQSATTATVPVDSEADREAALAAIISGPSSPISRGSTVSGVLRRGGTAFGIGTRNVPSDCCGLRSVKRVCCAACSAKLKEQCHTFRERDRKDQMLTELGAWKTPGNSDQWTKNYTPALQSVKQHLLSGIPMSLRKSYNMYSAQPISMASDPVESPTPDSVNPMFKPQQTDGLPTPISQIDTPMPGQRGAPTPMLPRRKFLPGFSAYSSVPHTPPKSALQRTARMFTKRGNQSKNALSARMTAAAIDTVETRAMNSPLDRDSDRETFHRKPEAWTLRVSKLDLLRLKHELQSEAIRGKIHKFHKDINVQNDETSRVFG